MTDRAPELIGAPTAAAEPSRGPRDWLDAPAVTGQQDANATVTALAEFAKCPRRYYLGHYLGFDGRPRRAAEPDEGESAGRRIGHPGARACWPGTPVAEPDHEALRLAGSLPRRARWDGARRRPAAVEREFDFLMAVDDLVIRGQVDLWFEEGGELAIVDYKTDAVTAGGSPPPGAGLRAAISALRHGRGAFRRAARADRAWLHFLRPNTVVEVDLAPSLLESPEQIVRDFEEAQSKLEFQLNEGALPPVRFLADLCPAGQG